MFKKRIIPSLLISNKKLIKTIKFKNEEYVGDPINAIKIFNEKEVDELFIFDKNISIHNIEPEYDYLKQLTSECFMPLCYGGGINSLEVAKKVFDTGLEKISLQTSAFKNPKIVEQLSKNYGSSSIVISIDLKKNLFGNYKIYSYFYKKFIDINIYEAIKNFQNLGAGEILINLIDKDGTLSGLDNLFLEKLYHIQTSIPILIQGGISSIDDIKKLVSIKNLSGIVASSFFIYYGPMKAVLILF